MWGPRIISWQREEAAYGLGGALQTLAHAYCLEGEPDLGRRSGPNEEGLGWCRKDLLIVTTMLFVVVVVVVVVL